MTRTCPPAVTRDDHAPAARGANSPVGLVLGRDDDGRQVLTFDSDQHHADGPRARALVFTDPRSRAMLPMLHKIAPSEANVLIVGETGTGKELVARYVHDLSARAAKPFLAVNCGAFSETLVEGELFGYERGAFTGAHVARAGWFEAANGGTLFLDEIGDLPPSLQVKLLRVLQEREVVRIGARKPIPLDVRVIAATNIDLQKAVNEGRFRSDLFYRIQVVPVPLLPLRRRRADILPLARHFLSIYGAKLANQATSRPIALSAAAEEALYNHPWPGNIRELENTIYRATLICQDGLIEPADLGLTPLSDEDHEGLPGALEDQLRPLVSRLLAGDHHDLLERLIGITVSEAFRKSGSNQIKTAEALGVTRNVVRTYLKNLGLI